MSMDQCNRCWYRDTLRPQPGGSLFCIVRESLVTTRDDCPDFEPDDDRWADADATGDPS